MKTILFICIHNSGRSQMAQAFFNQMAGGATIAVSAGTQPGGDINPTVREAMLEVGIDMKGQNPKLLTPEMMDQASRAITMGCGVDESCPINLGPAEDWGFDDPAGQPMQKVRGIRDQIKEKVKQLIKELD